MANRLSLGVLDQAPLGRDGNAARALQTCIDLACACEALGYSRFWIAEHHASTRLASPSPEILIARIARETARMRIGAGGIMLSHYSPFKVAETFRMLEALYPGRIDLGVGRAPGSDGLTAAALAYGNRLGIEYYPAKVADLVAFVNEEPPVTEAFAKLKVSPSVDSVPEIWVLASSQDSAALAARFGLALSFAHFISPELAVDAVQNYRRAFRPEYLRAPRAALGVSVLCTEDPARADLYRRLRELQRLLRDRGDRSSWPTLDDARDHPFTDEQLARIRSRRSRQIIGTPDEVRTDLERLAEATGAQELTILTHAQTFDERVESYRLLARSFGLEPPR